MLRWFNACVKRDSVAFEAGDAPVVFQGILIRKGVDFPDVLKFIVDASVNIDLALLGAWLYDKVKDRPETQLRIRRQIVTTVTTDGSRQVLEEEIKRG